ncbi:hypothetical protein O3G_MSEX014576 [Manduca sexta]|uniref:Uncharacterized protein n=1 Tax=Manduca sexta TaxID=7130 RepID=A0A921ZWG2_MANSE|nr:hypothetical protein O3G_MSEX014576 [Manduca sexta]
MNVREEDRRKPASSSRGLGFATAAIGLGVGAALYYFLSKGSPNQESEGTTSSNWTHERANVFKLAEKTMDSDSYSTISEGTTSDTSVHDNTIDFPCASSAESSYVESNNNSSFQNSASDTSNSDCNSHKSSIESDYSFTSTVASDSTESASDYNHSDNDYSDSESDVEESDKESDYEESENDETGGDYTESDNSETGTDYAESDISLESDEDTDVDNSDVVFEHRSNTESLETGYTSASLQHIGNSYDSETAMEWDVTNTSIGIPSEERSSSLLHFIGGFTNMISPRKA